MSNKESDGVEEIAFFHPTTAVLIGSLTAGTIAVAVQLWTNHTGLAFLALLLGLLVLPPIATDLNWRKPDAE